MPRVAKAIAVAVGYIPEVTKAINAMVQALANRALANPGLAIGTLSAAEIKIANAIDVLVNGVFVSVGAQEIAFTATTHDIAADAGSVQEAVYLLEVDSGGTVTLNMGAIATGAGNAEVPEVSSGKTAIGYLRLAVAAGATPFDATTDLLSAGHLTDTYVNIGDGHRAYLVNQGDG